MFLIVVLVVLAACGDEPDRERSIDASAARAWVEEIAGEVDAWATSDTLAQARAHAEAAANLIVGPGGPGYGDRDGDGTIAGRVDEGLLPARSGDSRGIVLDTLDGARCVRADVLGGEWDDPSARWARLLVAIRSWSPTDNTFPALPSHPMRVVGWATLAEDAPLAPAIEYAGHADIHVDVTRDALDRC